jgi:hypothetical protein
VVAVAENLDSTHRGPAVDVFNISGGRCRTCRQHSQGARHQHLPKLGTRRQNYSGDTYQGGHYGKHYHYEQGNITEK